MVYSGGDKAVRPRFSCALLLLCLACKGGGGHGGATVPGTTKHVEITTFSASSIAGAELIPLFPTTEDNLTSSGTIDFDSEGFFAHQLFFSNDEQQTAQGSYAIEFSGRMRATINNGSSLPGGVNPAEDVLYLVDDIAADDGRLGLLVAASPVNFPANDFPDFSGSYTLVGAQFTFPSFTPQDIDASAKTVHATFNMVHSDATSGAFFIDGQTSSGANVLCQGEFLIGNDLALLFTVDNQPNEVWTGAFADSGLLLITDLSQQNGDIGLFVAVVDAGFAGPGPLALEGDYLVTNLRFFSDASAPFSTAVEGFVRSFAADGLFADFCDPNLPCSGEFVDLPYHLDVNGGMRMADPFSLNDFLGAITPDLGTIVAVKLDGILDPFTKEAPMMIGIRLLN